MIVQDNFDELFLKKDGLRRAMMEHNFESIFEASLFILGCSFLFQFFCCPIEYLSKKSGFSMKEVKVVKRKIEKNTNSSIVATMLTTKMLPMMTEMIAIKQLFEKVILFPRFCYL